VLRGETRLGRLNPQEPQPVNLLPALPSDMSPAAQAIWGSVVDAIGATGVITSADAWILRLFAEAEARYEYGSRMLEETGILIQARGHGARAGELVKNPLHQIVRDNALLARAFARDLGLTPAARAALRGAKVEEGDPFEKFLMERSG
jgi:P27 family predicted phage terminase small subunit